MAKSHATIERGSGNVFAGLGRPDARLLKVELVSRIDVIVRQRGITQTEAGRWRGYSRADVSRLLWGDFREYSLKRRFRLFTALGRDADAIHPLPAVGSRWLEAAHRRKLSPPTLQRPRLGPPVESRTGGVVAVGSPIGKCAVGEFAGKRRSQPGMNRAEAKCATRIAICNAPDAPPDTPL